MGLLACVERDGMCFSADHLHGQLGAVHYGLVPCPNARPPCFITIPQHYLQYKHGYSCNFPLSLASFTTTVKLMTEYRIP